MNFLANSECSPQTIWDAPDCSRLEPTQKVLHTLRASSILLYEEWDELSDQVREELARCTDTSELLRQLTEHGLLTQYQASRIRLGSLFGLILGNYRVLERIGSGGMGVVFKAEHLNLRRQVAIKVLPMAPDHDPRLLRRFNAEMRAIAQLNHPNIVGAIDEGKCANSEEHSPILHYLVMEYIPGQDLEEFVQERGPLSQIQSCDLMYQIAAALEETDKHKLIHRDIKPSNIKVTPEGQAKLLDFGIVRSPASRFTQHGVVLGTVEYMAPEQTRDASVVDIRTDIYALGGTLFWCLTGRPPFQSQKNLPQQLACRMVQAAPSIRDHRPELPADLDAVVMRMMALEPADRLATPRAVLQALNPFLDRSGQAARGEPVATMIAEADDYLVKPSNAVPMLARSRGLLPIKEGREKSDLLTRHDLALNQELEPAASTRDSDLEDARNAFVLALIDLAAHRDSETGASFSRLQSYCRCLAEEAARMADFASSIDHPFIDMLECGAPLRDIGKAGLPDHILMKPSILTADDRAIMETHTIMGSNTLTKVAERHGFARAFLRMAIDITRHHHEHYDGKGYPDRLAGDAIPLSARIVAIADVYDALRIRRVYKPALPHKSAMHMMVHQLQGRFDPRLIQAFQRCEQSFERIFADSTSGLAVSGS